MASNSPPGFVPGNSHEDGPSPRTVNGSSVNANNTITIQNHGLETDTIIRFSGKIPEPLESGLDYQAVFVDWETIRVKTTSGVNVVFTGTHVDSDTFTLSRDTIVAFDALDWYSNSTSGTHFLATVNYKFLTVSQAYRWFVRNAGTTKLIILAGDPGSQNTLWSDTSPAHHGFNIGGGRCFDYLTGLKIWGYRGSDNYTTPSGGINKSSGGANTATGHAALTRARIILHLSSASDNIPIWFRIFGKVSIESVIFDFKIAASSTVPLATAFRCSHGLYSFINIGIVVWDSQSGAGGTNTGNTTGVVALEGGQVYFIQGSHLIQNCTSIGVCSSIGPSKIVVGTPNSSPIRYMQKTAAGVGPHIDATYTAFEAICLSENITLHFNKTFSSTSIGTATKNSTT